MKSLISVFLTLFCFTALAQPEVRTKEILMQTKGDNQTLISLNAQTNQTLPLIDVWLGYTNNVFTVSATGKITSGTNTLSSVGIQRGAGVTSADGTVTNTFPNIYTTLPTVTATQFGATSAGTNLITLITTSNFVYKSGAAGISNQWIAAGN